jgi:putative serine protease PepD
VSAGPGPSTLARDGSASPAPTPIAPPGGNGPPPRARPAIGRLALVAVCALLAGAGALAAVLVAAGAFHGSAGSTTVVERTTVQAGAEGTGGAQPRAVYAAVAPGVVSLSARVVTEVQTPFGPESQEAVQAGSGSVLDLRGTILTAEHVVRGATSVTVKLQDGSVRKARVLGSDPASDIAVVRIDPSGLTLHPLVLGSLRSLRIGDTVYAVGDPFGYARSMSRGLVSGLDRTIEAPNGFTVAHAIQTDAALNPGNSGGPLLDARGRVVGVVDQIATGNTRAQTNTGVGFAVPIDVVKSALPQLEQSVTPAHAYLGVGAADATPTGAVVQTVIPGTPAARAGVEKGDVVVALDGVEISGVSDLVAAVAARRPGDSVVLTVRRGSRRVPIRLTLATQPSRATNG